MYDILGLNVNGDMKLFVFKKCYKVWFYYFNNGLMVDIYVICLFNIVFVYCISICLLMKICFFVVISMYVSFFVR